MYMPDGGKPYTSKMRGKRSRRPRSSAKTAKGVKDIVYKTLKEQQELKVKYTTFDEQTITSGGENSFTGFTELTRGNAANQRIGNKVKPVKLIVEGWVRPIALATSTTDPNSAYVQAQYLRLSLLRVGKNTSLTSQTNSAPAYVGTNNASLFIGDAGLYSAETGDFTDIMRPYNWSLVRPMNKGCDKEIFLSMSPYSKNTKRVRYEINFSPKDVIEWEANSTALPNNGLFQMFAWSRFAHDDIQIASSLEFCMSSRFYYTDA